MQGVPMFRFLRRLFSKTLSLYQVAFQLAREPSECFDGLKESLAQLIQRHPQYGPDRNRIIDELQWVVIASGLAAIRVLAGLAKAQTVLRELMTVYQQARRKSSGATMFTPDFLGGLQSKLDTYLNRFDRGIASRLETAGSPAAVLSGAAHDLANEAQKYLAGASLTMQAGSSHGIAASDSEMPSVDALESYTGEVVLQSINHFREFLIQHTIE